MVGWAWTAASQTGTITTVAGTGTAAYGGDGGPATNAALSTPVGVAVDGGGNLFVADYSNSRVRRVDAATGVITTVAGMGVGGYNGDNIAATTAQLNQPTGMFADGGGNLRIADLLNQRIRREVCLRAAAT
jgi:adhesin/invasin